MLKKNRAQLDSRKRQQGFTLIELVIVMAILVVLAAIAVPRYNGILNESKVKSDAITAAGIASAARIQETTSGVKVAGYGTLSEDYFEAGKQPSSGGTFPLSGGANDPYIVNWIPEVGEYSGDVQTLTEGSVFVAKTI